MEVILPENPKTTQSKKTACAIPLVFAPLLHCTNKDSPRKTLTSSLVSHSSSRFSFDSRCCRLSSTECETVVQTQLWCKKKQNKLCGFNEFSVHWIFIPKELSRKKRGFFFSPTDQSCGAGISRELRLSKRPPLLRGIFHYKCSQTQTPFLGTT